jgi:hypothetical protein
MHGQQNIKLKILSICVLCGRLVWTRYKHPDLRSSYVPQVPAPIRTSQKVGNKYRHIQKSPSEIQTPTRRNLIGRSTMPPTPVSLPSSILPANSCHCTFIYLKKKFRLKLHKFNCFILIKIPKNCVSGFAYANERLQLRIVPRPDLRPSHLRTTEVATKVFLWQYQYELL